MKRKRKILMISVFVLITIGLINALAFDNIAIHVGNYSDNQYELELLIEIDGVEVFNDTIMGSTEWIMGKVTYSKLLPGKHKICFYSSDYPDSVYCEEFRVFYTHALSISIVDPNEEKEKIELKDIVHLGIKFGKGLKIG